MKSATFTSQLTFLLVFSFSASCAFVQPVPNVAGRVVARNKVTMDSVPDKRTLQLGEGDCVITILPNGKEIAIWVEKAENFSADRHSKGVLRCLWGERPFELGPTPETYIEQGPGTTFSHNKTAKQELFVDDWWLSYLVDGDSKDIVSIELTVDSKRNRPTTTRAPDLKEGESIFVESEP